MAGAVRYRPQQRAAQSGDTGRTGRAQAGVEFTETNFEAEVLARSTRCRSWWCCCRRAAMRSGIQFAMLGGLAAADAGTWSLTTVNVDTTPRVASIFGVQAVPTVVAVATGQPIPASRESSRSSNCADGFVAARPLPASSRHSGFRAEQVDPGLAKARELLEAGNLDAALGAYRALLDKDPHASGSPRPPSVKSRFLARATKQRSDAPRAADAAPDDFEAASRLPTWIARPTGRRGSTR